MARSGTGSGNLWKDIYFDSLSSGTLYPKSSSLKTSSLNPQPSTLSSRLHDQCNCRRLLYEDWYTPFGRLLLHISGYTICSLKSTFKQYVYTGRDDHVHCPDSLQGDYCTVDTPAPHSAAPIALSHLSGFRAWNLCSFRPSLPSLFTPSAPPHSIRCISPATTLAPHSDVPDTGNPDNLIPELGSGLPGSGCERSVHWCEIDDQGLGCPARAAGTRTGLGEGVGGQTTMLALVVIFQGRLTRKGHRAPSRT
jgi:hypothetical protein